MPESARRDDLELLGLNAAAGPVDVARAYRELKDLYAEDSLASYSLFLPEERSSLISRIEEAHARSGGRVAEPSQKEAEAQPASQCVPTADPGVSPGAFLRACREARGLSLQDVAGETKISSRHLENIEKENFAHLPVRVYLRGFLVAYAKALRLDDPREAAEHYLNKVETESAQAA